MNLINKKALIEHFEIRNENDWELLKDLFITILNNFPHENYPGHFNNIVRERKYLQQKEWIEKVEKAAIFQRSLK